MKNKFKVVVILLLITTLTGCNKYEKDTSYNTDIYGTYSENIEGYYGDSESNTWIHNKKYIFNKDNTFEYSFYEALDGEATNDINKSGKILSVEEISEDITKITLDLEITEWSTGETFNQTIYKYKNMLGNFTEIEVPSGKTFELQLNDSVWYDKDGQYHLCANTGSCDCSDNWPQYIRKKNIIYFQSMDKEHKNCYTIQVYITDAGLFAPEMYKE